MGKSYEGTEGELTASMAMERDWASMEVEQEGFSGIEVFVTAPAYDEVSASDDQDPDKPPAIYRIMVRVKGGGDELVQVDLLADTLEPLTVRQF